MERSALFGLLLTSCCLSPSIAQVPNGSFEEWEGLNYEDPVQWITTNNVAAANDMDPTCEKLGPGIAGMYYARVTSRTGPNGIIVMGTMVTGNSVTNRRGYPFTERPDALLGHWKYRIMPFDIGQITVTLSRWDAPSHSRVVIGNGSALITDSISDWEPFEVHINYAEYVDPDTAVVSVAASASPFAVVAGSTIQLDEVKFSEATSIADLDASKAFSIFPSPTSGPLTIASANSPVSLSIFDLTGREVLHLSGNGRTRSLDVSGFDPGTYLVQSILPDGQRFVRSFVKQ